MSLWSWFKAHTVDALLSDFHRLVDKLEHLSVVKKAEADYHAAEASVHDAKAQFAAVEAQKAQEVADKIKSLVSAV